MSDNMKDVIIAGGGLAGLTLALQLVQANPALHILVVEKSQFPIPNTTAKVGESTVEIGSHYFSEILGLKEHLETEHLRKFGLRCFFGQQEGDFSTLDELGVSQLFNIPSYQIERGKLENYLYKLLLAKGVHIIDGAESLDANIADPSHSVTFLKNGESFQYTCRWLVDAAGRRGLLRNKLNLTQPSLHSGHAVFFRINKKIIIDDWSENQAWGERITAGKKRWLSTNHLMGPGYWIWIIPLESGATSLGVVFDETFKHTTDITSFEKCLQWLAANHPKCAAEVAGAQLLDFQVVNDYSYGCKQFFSERRWAVVGEAGAFIDPFYSPGSDFIAISNTLVAHLIIQDFQAEDIRLNTIVFHAFYQSFVEHTQSLYLDQYGGFGDRQLMAVKLVWDYSYYWGVLALLFMKGAMTDAMLLRYLTPLLHRANELNRRFQNAAKQRAALRQQLPSQQLFLNQYEIPCLYQFTQTLADSNQTDLENILASNLEILEELANSCIDLLGDDPSPNTTSNEAQILGEYRQSVLGLCSTQ